MATVASETLFGKFQNRKRYEVVRNRTLYDWRQNTSEKVLLEKDLKSDVSDVISSKELSFEFQKSFVDVDMTPSIGIGKRFIKVASWRNPQSLSIFKKSTEGFITYFVGKSKGGKNFVSD